MYSAIGSFTNLRGGHVYPDTVRKADAKPLRVLVVMDEDGETARHRVEDCVKWSDNSRLNRLGLRRWITEVSSTYKPH